MKKLFKLSFIVLIPVILGIVLAAAGWLTENEKMAHAGMLVFEIGVPLTMVALVAVGLILIITGRTKLDVPPKTDALSEAENEPLTESEQELSKIADINSSYGYESQYRESAYIAENSAKLYKNSTPKEKILGWLFFGYMFTDFALIIVFAVLGIWIGAIICFALFALTILISAIVKTIIEKSSMRVNFSKNKNLEIVEGEVKGCFTSSMSSIGGTTSRITSLTFRVLIAVGDKDYSAYSHTYYSTGEKVQVVIRNKKLATIIENEKN